jgi:hypothetical protein
VREKINDFNFGFVGQAQSIKVRESLCFNGNYRWAACRTPKPYLESCFFVNIPFYNIVMFVEKSEVFL